MSFDITRQELSSFEQGFYRPAMIKGPITLARFSDTARGDAGRNGRFWLYGDYLRDLMETGHTAASLIREISQGWALCEDWGDKGLLSLMDVPLGSAVPAMWGRAKFQPKAIARETNRSYEGGCLQLVIPVVDTDRRLNLWLAGLIRRKFTTAQVLANPGLIVESPWSLAQRQGGRNI